MTANAPRPRGRLFFFAPGPTNIPDRVLGAMHRPTIDFFDPAFLDVQRRAVDGRAILEVTIATITVAMRL